MNKTSNLIICAFFALLAGNCSTLAPQPAQVSRPTSHPAEEGCGFVDSGQRLGGGRSWDVSLGDLDAFITHGQLGLSKGGGLPNEVWWNERSQGG